MKRFLRTPILSAIISSSIIFVVMNFLAGCSSTPLAPMMPIVSGDSVSKAGLTLSMIVTPESDTIMIGAQKALQAFVKVTIDSTIADSATKAFQLSDNTVVWSIESGDGNLSANGVYTAPSSLATEEFPVIIRVRSRYDYQINGVVRLLVRKPKVLPLALGNYWVYDVYTLDSTSLNRISGPKIVDSTIMVGTILKAGRVTTMAVTYRNNQAFDTTYFNNDGGAIWAYMPLSSSVGNVNIGRQWVKVLDPNTAQWIAFDTTFSNAATTFNGAPAMLNGRMQLRVVRNGGDIVQTALGEFKTQYFTQTLIVNLEYTINGVRVPIQYSIPTSMWYTDGVGQVRTISEVRQITDIFTGSTRRGAEERVLSGYLLMSQP